MATTDLSVEVWGVIALIAGLTVTLCLAVLASLHAHLVKARRLSEEVRDLRQSYQAAFGSIDFVDGPLAAPPSGPAEETPVRKAA
ncbi:MAG: hypothetical protein ACYSU7_00885 [Planctomycetota bacterium]|jgi:hypothetical protein